MGPLTRLGVAGGVLAAAVVAGVLLLGRGAAPPAVAPHAPLTVRATITPPVASFGDRLVARVAILADPRQVDVRRVRVSEGLAPLTPLGPARVHRSGTAIALEIAVSCLDGACTSDGGARAVELPTIRVEAPGRRGGTVRAEARWPTLEVRGRVLSSEIDVRRSPHFRANLTLPALRYSIAPGTLAGLLDGLAIALALGALALCARQALAWARRPRAQTRSELARALALAHNARLRPASDRRRALGLVARLLGEREEPLTRPVRDLAWSQPNPSRDDLEELVDRVSREVER